MLKKAGTPFIISQIEDNASAINNLDFTAEELGRIDEVFNQNV
jgi:hypothetical protein